MQRSTFDVTYPSGSGACKTNEIFNNNTVAELSSVNPAKKVIVALWFALPSNKNKLPCPFTIIKKVTDINSGKNAHRYKSLLPLEATIIRLFVS